jgi:hypothetical protein
MNQEIKANWVAALRSGDYKQGAGKLRAVSNNFCCLGVLCDLAVKEGVGEWELYMLDGSVYKFGRYTGSPSDKLHEWANLPMSSVGILTKMNDQQGKSFNEIADYIEENL